jgi:hypothetical protein
MIIERKVGPHQWEFDCIEPTAKEKYDYNYERIFKMKRFTDMKLLSGQEETITLMDFRKAPGDVITQVQMGKTFTLTKNGKPVAILSKPELNLGAEVRRLGLVNKK